MATQTAWRLHAYGGPECVRLDTDVPIPKPGPTQVLIATSIVAMNPFDWKLREGYYKKEVPLQLPAILGVDFVGTVTAVGKKASRFQVGDRVMSMSTKLGAFAEFIAVEEDIVARVPAALADDVAATVPAPALSAEQALRAAGKVTPGMTVLIHGASGVCGAFAVQLAKLKGAKVVATASGKNREWVMGLGADVFVDYRTEKFEDKAENVDLVLDFVLVGGAMNTTNRSWGVLKPNGALTSLTDLSMIGNVPEGKRGFYVTTQPDPAVMEEVADLIAAGKISSKVAHVYNRGQLTEAMEMSKAGGTIGRMLVDFKKA